MSDKPKIRRVAIEPDPPVSPGDLIDYTVTIEVKAKGITQWVKFGSAGMAIRAGERNADRIVKYVHTELDKRIQEALARAGVESQ